MIGRYQRRSLIRRQSTARRSSRLTPACPPSRHTSTPAATAGQTQTNELTGRSADSCRRDTAPSSQIGVDRANTRRKNRTGERSSRAGAIAVLRWVGVLPAPQDCTPGGSARSGSQERVVVRRALVEAGQDRPRPGRDIGSLVVLAGEGADLLQGVEQQDGGELHLIVEAAP